MTENQTQLIALAFSALGSKARLEILFLLVSSPEGALTAGELSSKLSLPPATLSYHLAILLRAKLIFCQPVSSYKIYSLEDNIIKSSLIPFLRSLANVSDEIH